MTDLNTERNKYKNKERNFGRWEIALNIVYCTKMLVEDKMWIEFGLKDKIKWLHFS